jgi:hypothetical protein
MQTIARANRIHEGKNNGLIVVYIETYKSLLTHLQFTLPAVVKLMMKVVAVENHQ